MQRREIFRSEEGQGNVITEFFKELFSFAKIAPIINPTEMDSPFNKEKWQKQWRN